MKASRTVWTDWSAPLTTMVSPSVTRTSSATKRPPAPATPLQARANSRNAVLDFDRIDIDMPSQRPRRTHRVELGQPGGEQVLQWRARIGFEHELRAFEPRTAYEAHRHWVVDAHFASQRFGGFACAGEEFERGCNL